MKDRIQTSFFRSLLAFFLSLLIMPTVINIFGGRMVVDIPIAVATLLVLVLIPYHSYMVTKVLSCKLSAKTAFVAGLLSGVLLAAAGRMGLAINYLIFSSEREFGIVIHNLTDAWWIYLVITVWGIMCMSIKPLWDLCHRKGKSTTISEPN